MLLMISGVVVWNSYRIVWFYVAKIKGAKKFCKQSHKLLGKPDERVLQYFSCPYYLLLDMTRELESADICWK